VLLFFTVAHNGWKQHTTRSQQRAEDTVHALRAAGLSHKEAAIIMRIPEPKLSEQLTGDLMLSAWREAELPDRFQVELAKRILARCGQDKYVVVEVGELTALITVVQKLSDSLGRWLPWMDRGKRRMAKVEQGVA
jgi:hypothetical protein